MAPRLNHLSQSPAQMDLQDPRGDVLADVLGVGLLRNALYNASRLGRPGASASPSARTSALCFT
jgi:hypothetical protein